MQRRLREAAMAGGATLVAPRRSSCLPIRNSAVMWWWNRTWSSAGRELADDVTIHSFCTWKARGWKAGYPSVPICRGCAPARGSMPMCASQFRGDQSVPSGARREGEPPVLCGRCPCGPGSNLGAGTITCNYEWLYQIPHGERRGGLHRCPFRSGRAGDHRDGAYVATDLSSPRTCRPISLALARGGSDQGRAGQDAAFPPCGRPKRARRADAVLLTLDPRRPHVAASFNVALSNSDRRSDAQSHAASC